MLVLDARLEEAIDRLDEVLAVEAACGSRGSCCRACPRRISRRHGQMPNDSGFGQGMCQNVRMVARGSLLADHRRQQREVVVLHQHDRVLAARLGDHRIGEALVDVAVVLPVRFAEHRPHVGDVAQRPHALVGEAVVVALLLLGAEPDAAQQVLVVPGRHADAVVRVDHLAVGAAAAVRDPGARAGAHHRLDRGHQAARRPLARRCRSCLRSWM